MGSGVSLNYQGTPQFGTILGGCLSLFVSIFFALFVCLTIYAWAFEPEYKYHILVDYLDVNSKTAYDVQTSVFLHTFILVSPDDKGNMNVFNDQTLFQWRYSDYATGNKVETTSCVNLIDSMTDLKSEERESIISELASEDMLCPNITSFKV